MVSTKPFIDCLSILACLTAQLYIDPAKLLPLARFLPLPPGQKAPGRGGRGGRGGGKHGFSHCLPAQLTLSSLKCRFFFFLLLQTGVEWLVLPGMKSENNAETGGIYWRASILSTFNLKSVCIVCVCRWFPWWTWWRWLSWWAWWG